MASIKWARAKAKTQKMQKDDIWVDFEQGRITKRERGKLLAKIPCNVQPVTVSRSREPTSGQQSRRKADRGDSLTVVVEPLWGPSDDSEEDYGRSFCSYKDACSWQCATPSSTAERSKELKNVPKPPAAPAPDQLHPEPKSKRMPRPPDAPRPAHLPPDQLHPQPETKKGCHGHRRRHRRPVCRRGRMREGRGVLGRSGFDAGTDVPLPTSVK